MKKLMVLAMALICMCACNSGSSDDSSKTNSEVKSPHSDDGDDKDDDGDDKDEERIPTPGGDPATYDPNRGSGKFTHVELGDKLDAAMATGGEKIYEVKCSACHKLTEERLVGPGWKGVTGRHKPEWIMNFITNPSEMIDKDPKLQAQLEICLVRMPNQSLTDDDARKLLEYMRKNDNVQ